MEAKSYLCEPGLLLPASLPEGGEEGAGAAVGLALKAQAEEGDQPQGVPAMCAVSLYDLRHLRIRYIVAALLILNPTKLQHILSRKCVRVFFSS